LSTGTSNFKEADKYVVVVVAYTFDVDTKAVPAETGRPTVNKLPVPDVRTKVKIGFVEHKTGVGKKYRSGASFLAIASLFIVPQVAFGATLLNQTSDNLEISLGPSATFASANQSLLCDDLFGYEIESVLIKVRASSTPTTLAVSLAGNYSNDVVVTSTSFAITEFIFPTPIVIDSNACNLGETGLSIDVNYQSGDDYFLAVDYSDGSAYPVGELNPSIASSADIWFSVTGFPIGSNVTSPFQLIASSSEQFESIAGFSLNDLTSWAGSVVLTFLGTGIALVDVMLPWIIAIIAISVMIGLLYQGFKWLHILK